MRLSPVAVVGRRLLPDRACARQVTGPRRLWHSFTMDIRSLSGPRRRLLAAAFIAALLLGAFGVIADEMREGETAAFDQAVARLFGAGGTDPWGPGWLQEAGRDVTALGSLTILIMVAALAVAFLLLNRQRHAALFVTLSVASGAALSSLFKLVIDRPRPDIETAVRVFTSSFPSGHATVSAVVYLTLGTLLAHVTPDRRLAAFFLTTAIGLTVLIGLSRIYLGVHYPTDVLAGWALGTAWALLCWIAANIRGRVIG
jgi:undecaprenyl-diphosphatase